MDGKDGSCLALSKNRDENLYTLLLHFDSGIREVEYAHIVQAKSLACIIELLDTFLFGGETTALALRQTDQAGCVSLVLSLEQKTCNRRFIIGMCRNY